MVTFSHSCSYPQKTFSFVYRRSKILFFNNMSVTLIRKCYYLYIILPLALLVWVAVGDDTWWWRGSNIIIDTQFPLLTGRLELHCTALGYFVLSFCSRVLTGWLLTQICVDMHRLNVSIAVIQVLILVYHSTMWDQLSQILGTEN